MSSGTLLAAVVATAVLVGCAAPQRPAPDGPSPALSPASPSRPAPATELSTAEPTEAGERVEVTIAAGEVAGPGRVTVAVGTKMQVVVTSDVADEVHVHGYDLSAPVRAGDPATLLFTAGIPGVFEVELEDSDTHLFELEVGG